MKRMMACGLGAAAWMVASAETNRVANATDEITELPLITVEASRTGRTEREIPAHVDTIDAAAIRETGAKNMADIVARVPGLNVMNLGGGNPALAQVSMRGFGESGFGRVLLNVDGERLDNPDMYAPNMARIPVSGISQVEILYGPQTVLHGDAASAGVINIVTEPNSYDRHAYAELHGGSWNTVGGAVGTRGGDEEAGVAYWADGAWDRSDGYRDHSGYDIWNAQGGVRKDFANGSYLKLSAFYNDSQYDLPGPLSAGMASAHPRRSTYDDWGRLSAYGFNFSGKGVFNDENELAFTFTVSERLSHFRNGDYTTPTGYFTRYDRDYHSDIWSWRFAPQYVNTTRIAGFDNKFILGAEYRWDRLHGLADTRYPDYGADYDTHEKYAIGRTTGGVFAHDEFFLCDAFSLSGGARLERAWNHNDATTQKGRIDDLVAGEAAANWRPVEDSKIFVRWTRFYRNPFIDEYRFRNYAASEPAVPEHGWNAEFGGSYDFLKEWRVSGVLFYSEIDNEIHYNPFTMSNENSPWLHRREGAEAAIAWERDKVAGAKLAWSGVNARKAEGIYKGNYVPGVPEQQVVLDGRVWVCDDFSFLGGFRMIGPRYAMSDTPNANGRLPTACTFRLGCRYEPSFRDLEGLSFAFMCDNLFDRNYSDYAVASVTGGYNYYYPAAGRSFTFTVRYEF